jgi:hypothetical protein
LQIKLIICFNSIIVIICVIIIFSIIIIIIITFIAVFFCIVVYPCSINFGYKFIFIKADEWKNIVSKFDKSKTYKLIDESEFIQTKDSSVDMAKDLFGKEIDIQ